MDYRIRQQAHHYESVKLKHDLEVDLKNLFNDVLCGLIHAVRVYNSKRSKSQEKESSGRVEIFDIGEKVCNINILVGQVVLEFYIKTCKKIVFTNNPKSAWSYSNFNAIFSFSDDLVQDAYTFFKIVIIILTKHAQSCFEVQ